MRKTRNSLGFTMAEMLIVVAIIAVLGGVAFIAVQNHQRSMAQLERNAIAKELFIAAQNHLTMAESEGYPVADPDSDYFGKTAGDTAESDTSDGETDTPTENKDTSDDENTEVDAGNAITNVYYVIGPASGNILDLMLPFGSIDETVRAGGSYLIRYQTNPARVLDVFYVTTSGNPARFNKDGGIEDDDYSDLMGMRDSLPSSGYVLGYYGGEEALASGDIILAPTVEVHNEERLTVTVTDNNNGNTDAALNNANAALKLIISGETSGAQMAITLVGTSKTIPAVNGSNTRFYGTNAVYTIVLDDITNAYAKSDHDGLIMDGLHFADLNNFANSTDEEKIFQFMQNVDGNTPTFYPGEDITVQAVAYSNTALTNIAYSSARTTNSLFADPGETSTTAMIANFRHLENLDAGISNLDKSLGFTGAEQIEDMIWKDEETSTSDFVQVIKKVKSIEKVKIYKVNDSTGGVDDCFLPVTPSAWVKGSALTEDSVELSKLSYEGNSHIISGVAINGNGDAGLFGALISESSVANLKLIDFNVATSEGNAGALIGKLTQKTSLATNKYNVSNVVAYNTGNGTDVTIKTDSGNAGGLIGKIVGDEDEDATDKTAKAVIQKSAAALIVSTTSGNAGGLIGTAAGGTVSGCYAGGHTIDDPKGSGAVIYSDKKFNVTAVEGYAGGLIGDAGNAIISNSYSTCSATGKYAGGFVGKGDSNGSATNCYAAGLVLGGDTTTTTVPGEGDTSTTETTITEKLEQEGAFAYSFGGTVSNCKFFEIINERDEKDEKGALTGGYIYLPPIPNNPTKVIDALDESAAKYNEFCGASTDWKPALPYDTKLKDYYGEGTGNARVARYSLQTVAQLDTENTLGVVEEETTVAGVTTPADFVATHHGDWPAPEIFVVNTK